MKEHISPKQTLLSAIRCRNTGKAPLYLRFWHMDGDEDTIPFDWRDQFARTQWTTGRGLCDTLLLQPPMGYIEEYDAGRWGAPFTLTRGWANGYPTLCKAYHTPEGDLRQEVRITGDWACGDDVYLFSDFNVSRAVKHAVSDIRDAKRLPYLLGEPSREAMADFQRECGRIADQALRFNVAVDGGWVALGDALVDLCGMERVLTAQFDEPGLLDTVLDTLLGWELVRTRQVIDGGADVIVYMAWYEGCDFWTPANWRKFVKPRLRQLVDLVHRSGRLFRYIITKGAGPIIPDLVELGVDCLTGLDPLQDALDVGRARKLAGDAMALMGGLNSSIMLSRWQLPRIRRAVEDTMAAVRDDPGFILFPVDAIFDNQPWDSVETLIGAWEQIP